MAALMKESEISDEYTVCFLQSPWNFEQDSANSHSAHDWGRMHDWGRGWYGRWKLLTCPNKERVENFETKKTNKPKENARCVYRRNEKNRNIWNASLQSILSALMLFNVYEDDNINKW